MVIQLQPRWNAYLSLLWYLMSRPSWARHILWYSRFNPANSGRRVARRLTEYDQNAIPPVDVPQKACASSPDQVSEALKRYGEGALHSDSSHRYLNQLREYQLALTEMKKGGILVSDDVGTDALADASDEFSCQLMVTRQSKSRYLGILSR